MLNKLCFSDILRYTARRLPNQPAFIDEAGRVITYKELNYRVNSLAHGLTDKGIKKGDKVAVLLPNCIEAVEIRFANAKIGAVSVPINHYLKANEIQFLLAHCEVKLLIAHYTFLETINSFDEGFLEQLKIIWVGIEYSGKMNYYNEIISSYPQLEIASFVDGNDACSILYTSGTTGNPKGVMRTHGNNYWAAISMATNIPFRPNEIELYVLPLWAIGFINIITPNILAGSTVLLLEGFDPEKIMNIIEGKNISRIFLVPAMWKIIMSLPNINKYNISNLRQVWTGGAPMSIETKLRMSETFPAARFYEIWGMTEGGLISIGPEEILKKLGSIGRPIPFNEARIVDDQGFDVPPGKVGEVVISGPSVTPGYYKNPEETKQSFDELGWFRTGDLARVDDEGYLYISGRKMEMIIFGNNKVYPGEIEDVLQKHPLVKEAVVFGLNHPIWGEVVAATVVTKNGLKVSPEELQSFVRKYLANYKVPTYIFFDDSLQLLPMGKIQREKLKKIYSESFVCSEKN